MIYCAVGSILRKPSGGLGEINGLTGAPGAIHSLVGDPENINSLSRDLGSINYLPGAQKESLGPG